MKEKQKKKRDYFALVGIFISLFVLTALFIIIFKYGVHSAFFNFPNPDGVWEKIINVGIFWVIGEHCISVLFNSLEKFRGKKK